MKPFDFLHKFFGFNKRERNGIMVLAGLLVALVMARVFIPHTSKELVVDLKKIEALTTNKKEEQSFQKESNYKNDYSEATSEVKTPLSLFPFDPNTISVE